MKIIKERTPVEVAIKCVEFNYLDDESAGFSFPANDTGGVDIDHMSDIAIDNYRWCISHSDEVSGPYYRTYKHTYTEPAVGKCSCGREIVLDTNFFGAVRCNCDRWYNVFGQELVDPKYWEEPWDDEY